MSDLGQKYNNSDLKEALTGGPLSSDFNLAQIETSYSSNYHHEKEEGGEDSQSDMF